MGVEDDPVPKRAVPDAGSSAYAPPLVIGTIGDPGDDFRDMRLALAFSQTGCWSLSLPTGQLQTTACCKTIYGALPSERFEIDDLIGAIHPGDRPTYHAAVEAAVRDGNCLDLEHRLLLRDGRERWVELHGQVIHDGRAVGPRLICTVRDITSRKRDDLHRTLLAKELNHRVKNSFALTQAVIGQTIRSARSIAEVGNVLDVRLSALAVANDLLLGNAVQAATILDVLRRALSPFGFGTADQIQWAGPDIPLPAQLVASLSLALHELATNAMKFGALSRAEGGVRLVWQSGERDGTPCFSLTWEEHGGPPVVPPIRTGFGTRLIERCLGIDVGGFTAIDYRTQGIVFTAVLPMAERGADDGAPASMGMTPASARPSR